MARFNNVSKVPMPNEDANLLRSHFTFLEKHIDAAYLITYLFQDLIIDEEDMNRINSTTERSKRNKDLLQTLLQRGDRAWGTFIVALRECGFREVANELFNRGKGAYRPPSRSPTCATLAIGPVEPNVAVYQASWLEVIPIEGRTVRTPSDLNMIEANKADILFKEVQKLEKQLEELNDVKNQNENLKGEINIKDETISRHEQTIERLTKELVPLRKELAVLRNENVAKSERVDALEVEVRDLKNELLVVNRQVRDIQKQLGKKDKKSSVCNLS